MDNVQPMSLKAAADFLGNGAVEVPIFENEIMDAVRRSSVALQRFPDVKATGHPHRYIEQTAIAVAASTDPRNIQPQASGPTRVERPAFIKASVGQTNLSLFDKEVTEQQGQFVGVVAKDINDIVSGIQVLRGQMLWNGSDTSLVAPTTPQWMGGLAQITQEFTVSPGSSIIDGVKTAVATMVSNVTYTVRPTGCFLNGLLGDLIDQEAKASHIELAEMEVTAGVTVSAIATQAGKLPLIPDVYMPICPSGVAQYGFNAPAAGLRGYYAVIVTEAEVEIATISGQNHDPKPRVFQLGLTSNLAGQYVGVKFDTVIFKGASYMHAVVQVLRP